ncbi:chemotaxis protein CheW [Pseudomonas songnenensis]|uniref:Chemotaxis protein CheW n=1 Tax=Pseudomonas songnenensis TaxID=1176259 RepID=A0A482UBQ4_9PSED|nr:chemotaxis protein CheW [Pseudomonas songnenensis]AWM60143.1 chemotaxis protein [Stutzerimonas stutzeri]MCQ4299063.1 chemotaxis protein CheW [Pseudomonas songnenensis]RMH99348.1 chemotaxis protein CheW [Pseudomonas songnenensis]RYJ64215.1 chemotaxis protein CheW [Pseudomonas songnenensis]
MSQMVVSQDAESLTGLLMPLADRMLLMPNVAVAELIPYRAPQAVQGMPAWFLGQVQWRDLSLPLLSFEAASSGQAQPVSNTARVAVLNAVGGRNHVKFIALLVQGIPHSIKVDASLARADVALAPLELDAVNLGDVQARIPDLVGLEQKLADAGLI